MLYETLAQPKVFLVLFAFGFLSGLIFDFLKLLNYFFDNNKISRQIFTFLGVVLSFLIFVETNLWFNYGDIRFFAFFSFFLALILQRATLGKLLAKFMDKCYNFLKNLGKRIIGKLHGRKKKEQNH